MDAVNAFLSFDVGSLFDIDALKEFEGQSMEELARGVGILSPEPSAAPTTACNVSALYSSLRLELTSLKQNDYVHMPLSPQAAEATNSSRSDASLGNASSSILTPELELELFGAEEDAFDAQNDALEAAAEPCPSPLGHSEGGLETEPVTAPLVEAGDNQMLYPLSIGSNPSLTAEAFLPSSFTGNVQANALSQGYPVAGPSNLSRQMPTGYETNYESLPSTSSQQLPPGDWNAFYRQQTAFGQGTMAQQSTFNFTPLQPLNMNRAVNTTVNVGAWTNRPEFVIGITRSRHRLYLHRSQLIPLPRVQVSASPSNQLETNGARFNNFPVPASQFQAALPSTSGYPQNHAGASGFVAVPNALNQSPVSTARPMHALPKRDTKGKGKAHFASAPDGMGPPSAIPPHKFALLNNAAMKHGLLTPSGSQTSLGTSSPTTPFPPTLPSTFSNSPEGLYPSPPNSDHQNPVEATTQLGHANGQWALPTPFTPSESLTTTLEGTEARW